FDTAWIRARERSQREQHLVEGELLAPGAPPVAGRTGEAGDDALARWARAQPTAGVRGGASAAAGSASPLGMVQDAAARLSDSGKAAVDALRHRVARRQSRSVQGEATDASLPVPGHAVRLGPFADQKTAAGVRARVGREW